MKPVRPMSRFGRRMTHAHTPGTRLDKRQETIRASKSIGRGIQAVLPVAAHYFENRTGDAVPGQGLPVAVQALLETQQPVRL